MKTKLLAASFLLAFLPAATFAQGCNSDHDQQAMSCAEGTIWDAESGTCTAAVTG